MKHLRRIAMVLAVSLPCGILNAQSYPPTYIDPDGSAYTCYAPHAVTGEFVPVVGINGTAGGFMGYATYDRNGWPTIIFDVALLAQQPAVLWRFVYYHECAHLETPTMDEVRANCIALRAMRERENLTPEQEQIIAAQVSAIPVLPRQYGGSGLTFWNNTLQCAQ